MRLIDDDQEIIVEVVNQGVGRLPRRPACQVAGIIFNTGAKTCLLHHLDVKVCPLFDALRFDQLVICLEILHLVDFSASSSRSAWIFSWGTT